MSNEQLTSCGGCGKDNHSIYFSGNIQSLSAKEIKVWLKSIKSPPFVRVNKSIDHGYGIVHCDTYEDACVFFHKMKHKKHFGPSGTVMKFSEAKGFRSKKLVVYKEIIPQTSTITSTFSSTSSSSDQPKNDTPISPVIDLTQVNTQPAKKDELLAAQKEIIAYQGLIVDSHKE